MTVRRPILVLLVALICQSCSGQEITIAAAADLQPAMQEMAARFEKETGNTVKLIYGSSGNFFQQIQNGAPFDIFFSANLDYPRRLEAAGLTVPGGYYQYAKGKIVIWVPRESKIDLSSGMQALLAPSVKKIAIANPQHAPYGQAAVAALQQENVYDKLKDKFVLGENISQTASFVVSGAADAGIIALSLVLSPNMRDKGRYVAIPALFLVDQRTKTQPGNSCRSSERPRRANCCAATASTCQRSKQRNERQSRSNRDVRDQRFSALPALQNHIERKET